MERARTVHRSKTDARTVSLRLALACLYGNGDSGNQGPHQTDIARWGLGIDSHPVSVISYGGRLGYQAERKDDNYVDAGDTANTQVSIYDYGDKCIVFETRLGHSDARR